MRIFTVRILALVVLVALLLAATPARAGVNTWTPLGPPAFGSLSAFIVDPQTPTTFYAIVHSSSLLQGIYKSSNSGQSWQRLDLAAPSGDTNVNFLTLDPTNSNTLYAGVGGEGLYKSTDSGDTWQPINNGLPIMPDIYSPALALAVHPTTPTTLYAAIDHIGLFRSTDGGASWSQLTNGLPPANTFSLFTHAYQPNALVIDPEIPSTIYLALGSSGVFKSIDGGDSWQPTNNGLSSAGGSPPTYGAYSITLDPETSTTLYAVTLQGVYKSTDGAASWARLSELPVIGSEYFVTSLLIVPGSPQTLLAASVSSSYQANSILYRSVDGGDTWTQLANTPGHFQPAMTSDGQTPATVYIYDSVTGMVFDSTDNGDTWIYTGFGVADGFRVSALAVSPHDPAKLYIGGDGGYFSSQDRGLTWILSPASDDVTAGFQFITVDPISPTLLYAGRAGNLLRSVDDGVTWQPHGTGLPNDAIRQIAIDSQTPTTLYAQGSVGVLRSIDGGDTWTLASGGLAGDGSGLFPLLSDLDINPQTPSTLYATTLFAKIYKSVDGARNWSPVNTGLPESFYGWSLTVDSQTPSTLYLLLAITTPEGAAAGKLYKSVNSGATWEALPFPTFAPDNIISPPTVRFTVDAQRPTVLYALGEMRLVNSVDGGFHWYTLPTPLASDISVNDLIVDPATVGRIYLATTKGVQVADLSAALTVDVVVLGTAPADAWTLTGPKGDFTLPAAGGSQNLGRLALGAYEVSITPQPDYTVQSVCTHGIGAGDHATANAAAGQIVTCTFYASAPDAPRAHLPMIGD